MNSDKILHKKNATLFPARKNDFGGGENGKVLFGVKDEDRFRGYCNHERGEVVWEDPEARNVLLNSIEPTRLEGEWLYAGPLFFHFGHFVSESIAKLWAYRYTSTKIKGIIFIVPPYIKNYSVNQLPGYIKQVFQLLQIPLDKIFFTNDFLNVDGLFIPKSGTILGVGKEDWYEVELQAMQDKYNLSTQNDFKKSCVFVSRKNFKNNGRIMGLDYFEKLFLNDVNIVIPESLSIHEQVTLMSSAKKIVFEEGSSLHLLDLLPKLKVEIILLKRRKGRNYLEKMAKEKSTKLSIFDDIEESPQFFEGDQKHNIASRLSDPESFFMYLQSAGLINQDFKFDSSLFIQEESSDLAFYLLHKIKSQVSFFN